MTDNVIELPCITRLDIPVNKILANAAGAKLKKCVVVGIDDEGDQYFSSSVADGGDVLWMLARAVKALMDV